MLSCLTLVLATSLTLGQAVENNAKEKQFVPDNVLEEFAYLVGEWKADFFEDNTTGTGVSSTKWAIGKQAITQEQTWELTKYGTIKAIVLVGWDTAKQEFVEATFFSGGGGAVRRYKLQSPGVWAGQAQHFHPDGRPEASKVRIERKSEDEYTWTETERSLAGPTQKPIVVKFFRVKK